MQEVSIRTCTTVDQPGWLELRMALWPHSTREEHMDEMAEMMRQPGCFIQFVACVDAGKPVGLLEMSLRTDYVNGTESSPVAFLEGLYVMPEYRFLGIARALLEMAESWGRQKGCDELASDALLENKSGQAVHRALGFEETERVVCFRKLL